MVDSVLREVEAETFLGSQGSGSPGAEGREGKRQLRQEKLGECVPGR